MGPLVACVYVADKALPLHDTYIHTYHENLSAHSTFYFFFNLVESGKFYFDQLAQCHCAFISRQIDTFIMKPRKTYV